MKKIRFFRYSGAKLKFVDMINKIINVSSRDVYVEPFVGSGAVLFNLQKEFDRYIINDIDRNIIRMYLTFKEIDYSQFLELYNKVNKQFSRGGILFSPHNNKDKEQVSIAKENYYRFRDWFNQNHFMTDTIEEGFYLHILANKVINSFFRYSKNGINQGWGDGKYTLDEFSFNAIHDRLQKVEIYNTIYKEIILKYQKDGLFFIDPPYFQRHSSYSNAFDENDIKELIDLLSTIEYIYTDTLHEYNINLPNKILMREMVSSSPNRKTSKNGHLEYVFSSIDLDSIFRKQTLF